MPAAQLSSKEIARRHAAVRRHNGNFTYAAKELGDVARQSLAQSMAKYPDPQADTRSSFEKKIAEQRPTVPAEPASTRVVLMTAAQDDTGTYDAAWANLQAYAGHRGAEIMVGGFTYQKGLFEDHMVHSGAFAQKVIPFIKPDVVDLAPRLTWFGKANILPTAVDPLTGWETNTREKWAIFPHAKIALKCVPVMPGKPGKQIMTTGVITKPNYVQRNAGQKAEFHHTPGATIAEIKPDGTFFLRQIGFDKGGSFQDLNYFVCAGAVSENGPPLEAITWGDIHFEEIDQDLASTLWGWDKGLHACPLGAPNMLDDLKPKHQFFHDSFSFKARSHHTRKDPHERALLREEGGDHESIQLMLQNTAEFLKATTRPWSRSIHVPSNHNNHLHNWLKDSDGHFDAANAYVWHKLNAAWFEAIEAGEGEEFSAHAHALQEAGDLRDVTFLHAGQSYLICQDTAPIECGLHGDVGPRGSRGSPSGLAKVVERINSAHTHEPQIRDGLYVAGTSSRLDLKYATKGPGAWHHAEIITYASGKRAIITLNNGAYRS